VARRSKSPKPVSIDDPRYLKAIGHPLRMRILALLSEEASSPARLATRLGEPLGNVAYHVRTLSGLGLLELVETRPVRGTTEHFYRTAGNPVFSDRAWAQLGPVGKQQVLSSFLRDVGEQVNGAAAAGGFDRADAHFSRLDLQLDDEGWSELAEATRRWAGEAQAIAERAGERGGDRVAAGLVLLLFEAAAAGGESANGAG
jgi:DNA-binding transcriptional ArsR family regulator